VEILDSAEKLPHDLAHESLVAKVLAGILQQITTMTDFSDYIVVCFVVVDLEELDDVGVVERAKNHEL